jgi:hypothetical protein
MGVEVMIRETNGVVNWTVYLAIEGCVRDAVYDTVHWDVHEDVYGVIPWAVNLAVGDTIHRTVRWAVTGDVDDDTNHPGLQDFLLEAWESKSDG